MESLESRRERSVEMRDQDDSHVREKWEGGYDDFEENRTEKSRDTGKHRSKERSKSSRREEKDHRSRDRERSKASDVTKERERASKDLEKDRATTKDGRSRDDQNKDRTKDKRREKDYDWDKYKDKERDKDKDKDRKDRGKERDRDRETEATDKDNERAREKERSKEKGKDRDKERDRAKDKEREKERDKNKDRDREREIDNDRDRDVLETEKGKERIREERESGQDKERSRERDKVGRKHRGEGHDRGKYATKDDTVKLDREDGLDGDITTWGKGSHHEKDDIRSTKYQQSVEGGESRGSHASALELEERISKMKEERMRNKSEGLPEILAWVNKSRKLEERRSSEKEKALQLSKIFEEKDNINQGEIENEAAPQHIAQDLAGVKVLHGLDKVIECGAVVLTLKDHSILAGGDINQEVDMLENVEIGEQKRRNEAYSSAKKKTGIYDDKFNDEPGSEKKILQKYDDPVVEEGITLDASGRFTGDAEKKLEELRRRIQGVSTNNHFEDLNSSDQIKSDYYTHEERLQFKKPKKKKSLRKKEKLDINALEVEAVSAGLGVGDLGSRKYEKRQAIREEKERSEAEKRSNAHQAAYAKADEASKALRLEQTIIVKTEEDDNPVFGDDDEDLRKSLERARKFALKKQDEASTSGPQAIAFLASSTVRSYTDSGAGVGYGSLSVPFLIYQFFGERLATSEERLAMTEQRLATSNPTTKACDLRLPLVDCKFLYPSSFSSPLMSAVSEKIMPNPTHISHPHPCRVVSTRVLCPKPASPCSNSTADDQNPASGETQENKVVFTEMEEFVWGLQLDEEAHKPDGEDVFMEEDVAPIASDQEMKDEDGGWTEVNDTDKEEPTAYEDKEEIVPDEMIHEAAVGKGLSGALKLLKERGSLKETVERGGRNMDKKKSKLVGIYDTDRQKEIRIERTDEFGRILTPKEAFRLISHKFHGKGPGKTKQEKRIRQYQEELKVKQMMPSDTPSLSVERMREAQARLKTPYLVLSGHVKPGQTSDPRSGFATVEKDLPGGLTPMLGDRKVEHFLGIKRKAEPGDMGPPKKPKT